MLSNSLIFVEWDSHAHAWVNGPAWKIQSGTLSFRVSFLVIVTLQSKVFASARAVQGQVRKEDVTIVIPTLNEVEAIGKVIDELKQYGYEKILVVDGHSTDGTAEVATSNGVDLVEQLGTGKTGALATAVEHVSTPYFLVMDGDLTYDPGSIERLLAHGGTYDEVIGARTAGRENIPLINRFGNRLISWFFKILFGVHLSDVCSGMYLLKTSVARRLEFTTGGFDVEVEIAAQFANSGKIADIPINYRKRIGQRKLSTVGHGLTILASTVRLANAHNPVVLYSGFLALSAIPAIAILAWVAYERILFNIWHSGYALVGLMMLVLSLQSLSVTTMSLMIKRSEQRIYRAMKTQT